MGKTFSENWHRVASLRLGLRPTVLVRLHHYRGEPWYVLHERLRNGFFRVNPVTWRFIARLDVSATVDEVWRRAIEDDPAGTPGQEEVFQLLMQLYGSNLLYLDGSADERRLLERGEAKKRKPFLNRLSQLMFMRIPLLDPEPWLRAAQPWIRGLISLPGALVALALVGWGAAELVMAGNRAFVQATELLQGHNIVLLYLAIFVAKGLHELGHAVVSKRFGCEVRTIGVMLLMFTPLPYVDVSSSWALRDRWQRAAIGAAGMMVDIVVAAVASIVWAHTPYGQVNDLAYNLMFTTAIYTVLFNLNPLMRFDGYYILSDLVGIPNLHEQSKQAFRRLFRARLLREGPSDEEPPHSPGVAAGLVGFFLASNLYRLFVMAGIVFFIADAYFGVGLVVAVALGLTSFVLPLKEYVKTVRDPVFRHRHRTFLRRACAVAALLVLAFLLVPVPDNRVLRGVAEAASQAPVFTEASGLVAAVHVPSGTWVEAGTPLVDLVNPELEAEIRGTEAQAVRAELMAAKSVEEGAVDLAPIEERLRTLATIRETLAQQRAALQVRAAQAGTWVAPDLAHKQGAWVGRGTELGKLIDDRSHVFRGVIRQEEAAVLVAGDPRSADRRVVEVRLEGERGRSLAASGMTLVPYSRDRLPSAALGPAAGGEVPVTTADPTGRQSVEPYFLLEARIDGAVPSMDGAGVRNGRAGWIRVPLPWRPLAEQVWTWTQQFFQRRYRI